MDQITSKLETLISHYCADFSRQLRELSETLDHALEARGISSESASDVFGLVHRMAGAAHCMGYKDIGRAFDDFASRLKKADTMPQDELVASLTSIRAKVRNMEDFSSNLNPARSKLLQRLNLSSFDEACDVGVTNSSEVTGSLQRILAKERILIAEDDPHVQEMVETCIKGMGCENVIVANSGSEVLPLLHTFQPTLIITDWHMEPLDGHELLQLIRGGKVSVDENTPVIFFTSEKEKAQQRFLSRSGANKVLTKPVLPNAIWTAVAQTVEKKYHIRKKLNAVA